MDLVSALKVLQAADEKELQSHRRETISTLRQVCQRLQAHISADGNRLVTEDSGTECAFPPSANVSRQYTLPATSVIENAPDVNPRTERPRANDYLLEKSVGPSPLSNGNITRQNKAPPKSAEALFKAVISAVSSIWSIRNDNVSDIISPKRSPTTDRRIEDISRIEEDIDAKPKDRLLRASALLSLASEFESYQQEHNEISRVDSIVQLILQGDANTKSIHERKGSAVAKYVKGTPQFKGKERLISRAIGNGVKFTVANKLLERRLKDRGTFKECHAVLLVLGFIRNRLSMASYKTLLELVDRLLSDQALVALPQDDSNHQSDNDTPSQRHVLDVLCELSPWSKMFQCCYKYSISPASPMHETFSRPSKKRMRHSQRDGYQDSCEIHRSPDFLAASSRNSHSVPTPPSRNDAESNRATSISTDSLELNANNSQKSQPTRPIQADMQIVLQNQTNTSPITNSNDRSPHNSVEFSTGNGAIPDQQTPNPDTIAQEETMDPPTKKRRINCTPSLPLSTYCSTEYPLESSPENVESSTLATNSEPTSTPRHESIRDASSPNILDAQLADNAGTRSQLRHNTAQLSDSQAVAERVDVQNGIQCQANINTTSGFNNPNDCVVEQFPSGDQAALQFSNRPLMEPTDHEIATCEISRSDSSNQQSLENYAEGIDFDCTYQQTLGSLNYAEGIDFDCTYQQTLGSLNYAEGIDFDGMYQQTLESLNYAEGIDFNGIYQQTFGI